MPEGGPILSVVPGGAATHNGTITIVGILGESFDGLPTDARRALGGADWIAASGRHLDAWRAWLGRSSAKEVGARAVPAIEADRDLGAFAEQVAQRAVEHSEDVCVIASGDPGFFGVVGALLRVVERSRLKVFPVASSVAVAFARLGLPWDDAAVIDLSGRTSADAVQALRVARKAAVLTSPEVPPQTLGRALVDVGVSTDLVAVCSRLGCPDERVIELDLDDLAVGAFDPMSVVILIGPGGLQTMGWEEAGATSAGETRVAPPGEERVNSLSSEIVHEVSEISRAKLMLPGTGVLWDVEGAEASVAVGSARARPGLTVFAIAPTDAGEDAAGTISDDAASAGVAVHVVSEKAPGAFERLPDPDRVFLGSEDPNLLDAAIRRLRPGGRVVAAFGSVDRAVAAAERLGSLSQIAVSDAKRDDDGSWSLVARDPVFLVWGP